MIMGSVTFSTTEIRTELSEVERIIKASKHPDPNHSVFFYSLLLFITCLFILSSEVGVL